MLKVRYLTATIGMRGTVKQLFTEVEKYGGYVTYREHKGFFETTYTHIRAEGERWLLQWMVNSIRMLADEDQTW